MKSNKRILQWENHSNISSPPLKNHTTTLVDSYLYIFGGYDGRKNYSTVQVFDTKLLEWIPKKFHGESPDSRNGHTATLVDRIIYIIGGWIESLPSAGKDVHRLDVDKQCWIPTPQSHRAPVCNMHTADYIPHLNMIFVFRGGDGREYLNDLHTYDIATLDWVEMEIAGTPPTKRANHSSARINNYLYIFGGWNGRERLNDLYILDTVSLSWSQPICEGFLPQPRAGMSLTVIDDELFLFGGNGPSSQRYDDLRILSSELTPINSDDGIFIKSDQTSILNSNNNNNQSRTFIWKVCLGVNEYSLLSSLSYESAGGSMQDGDSDPVQSNISSYSLTCPFCISGTTNRRNLEQKNGILSSTFSLPSSSTQSIPIISPNNNNNNNNNISSLSTSKPLCPYCNRCIIQVRGNGPGKRAGHTATAVGTRIFFIGGGFGSEYVQNIHILDTDACLKPEIISLSCHHQLQSQLRSLFNSEELADVIFIFPNERDGIERRVYAHRILLSLTCNRFKAMFRSGCRESFQLEIPLEHTDYTSFLSLLEYLYTGEPPSILKSYLNKIQSNSSDYESTLERNNTFLSSLDEFHNYHISSFNNQNDIIYNNSSMNNNNNNSNNNIDYEEDIPFYLLEVLNILEIADEYFCDPSQNYLKEVCEVILSQMVTFQSVEYIYSRAERSNAHQLQEVCQHVMRSMKSLQSSL